MPAIKLRIIEVSDGDRRLLAGKLIDGGTGNSHAN
jgi:hypothetical protein